MNKFKIIVALGACVMVGAVFAGPRGFGGHGFGPRPGGFCHRPPMHHFHPAPRFHHHGWSWGRGGCNFWPGFVGGVVGGIIGRTIVDPAPVVVTTPTVVTTSPTIVTTSPTIAPVVPVVAQPVTTVQNVWVEGCYVDQVQANGTTVRVWNPGHYEQRTVTVQ